jgi:hypothetical protein
MARRVTQAMVNRAIKEAERAKLQAKVDKYRAQEITATDPVKRKEARAKRMIAQGQKDAIRVRRRNGKRG